MCIHKTPDGLCRKYSDDTCTSYCVEGPCPHDTPSTADHIRAMSDEELIARALVVAQRTIAQREARIAALSAENEIMQPKAEYFDVLVERNTLTTFRETAKELGAKPKAFVNFLLEKKYVFRDNKGKLMPYEAKNDGLFEVKECASDKNGWSGVQTLITPKGRETFRLIYSA